MFLRSLLEHLGRRAGRTSSGHTGEATSEAEEEAATAEAVGRLAKTLWLRLRGWEAVLAAAQRLLVWEKPLHSLITAAALNGLFW